MANREARERPETGWGIPFADHFDNAVTVVDHARDGRSTHTLLEEGRWCPIAHQLTRINYVFIQFGHNDEVSSKEQHATEAAFVGNLRKFVDETREQGATPVLLTSVAHHQLDDGGIPRDTRRAYTDLTRTVTLDHNVSFIDMDERTRTLLAELGPDTSTTLHNHLEPSKHSNYSEGIAGDMRFSGYGAHHMADVVLGGVTELDLGLTAHVES